MYEELLQYYFPCEESDPEKTTGHEKGDLKESSSKEVPKASFEESDSKEVTSDAFQEPDSKEGIKKSSQELRPKETDECVENPESELNKGNEGDEILMDDDSELTKRVEELDEIPGKLTQKHACNCFSGLIKDDKSSVWFSCPTVTSNTNTLLKQ